jgi:hypothetical protein
MSLPHIDTHRYDEKFHRSKFFMEDRDTSEVPRMAQETTARDAAK